MLEDDERPDVETTVRSCRGLVRFDRDSGVVRLSHQTVVEYLRTLEVIQGFEKRIVATCFTRLAMNRGEFKLPRRPSTDDEDAESQVSSRVVANDQGQGPARTETMDFLNDLDNPAARQDDGNDSGDDGNEDDDWGEDDDNEQEYGSANFDSVHKAGEESVSSDDSSILNTPYFDKSALDRWAKQDSSFSRYAGEFTISHFLDLNPHERDDACIAKPMWTMLTKQHCPDLLASLKSGKNRYPGKVTPLHVAVWLQHAPTLRRLLEEEKLDINVGDLIRWTPLMTAAAEVGSEMIRELLDLGADPGVCGRQNAIAVEVLRFDVSEDLVRRLMPPEHKFEADALLTPAFSGYSNVVKVFLELGIGDPNFKEEQMGTRCTTALHDCCQSGHFEVAQILLGVPGIEVNVRTIRDGISPLHSAVDSGNAKLVALLLEKGTDPNLVDDFNEHSLLRCSMGRLRP